MSRLSRSPIHKTQPGPHSRESSSKASAMSKLEIKESDIAILIAAIQNSVGPVQVDAEKVAKQLGMSLSTIPPKFTTLRKRYNIDIKVLNSGALQRNRGNTPKKAKSRTNIRSDKPEDSLVWPEDTTLNRAGIESPSPITNHDVHPMS